jgi:hypothetical protein
MAEPTEETIQETIEEVDGRTTLGKRLKAIEEIQEKILQTLAEHQKRIEECSIRR